MIILSIETSCDETAAAIVKFNKDRAEVLANIVSSQIKTHSKFGGVVPSLASRMHLKNMIPVLKRAFKEAKKNFSKELGPEASELGSFGKLIDYIAATNGPGLIPALMIGMQAAKTLSYALNKPLIPINHIEGHIYANWLKPVRKCQMSNVKCQNYTLANPEFPVLCLIVSGGHTQLILMKKDLDYKIIGETLDDAAGEAFDKVAKLLDLGYPGGPVIEKTTRLGDKNKFKFPRPMMNSNDYNFSFSGLKTAVLYKMKLEIKNRKLENKNIIGNTCYDITYKQDIAASFQQAVIDVLISKTIRAAKQYKAKNIILGGGVSANKELQKQLGEAISKELPTTNYQPPTINLSTDNALMIAAAGYYHILNNKNMRSWKNVKADANLALSM